MIFTNLSPNSKLRDHIHLAPFFLFPWKWYDWYEGNATNKVITWFEQYLNTNNVYLLDSGRSALLLALRAMDIKPHDEIIVPGYTCIVVTNAIRAVGAVPKLVDVTGDLNIDTSRIEKEIRPHTKAILAQHTFGLPCDVSHIRQLCDQYKLVMIEDCAHALGAHVAETPVGTFGDVSFFSFGSDKIVSSVRGGVLIVKSDEIAKHIEELNRTLQHMPKRKLWQHVLYASAMAKGKAWYRFGGKAVLYFFRKFGITAVITESTEKHGNIPNWTPTAYPNILASMVYPQLRTLYNMKMKRRIIAEYYLKFLPKELLLDAYAAHTERTYLHFPILVDRVEEYRLFMKKKGIQIGTDWNGAVIAPASATQVDAETADIPTAKVLSNKIVQLPIHQNMTVRKAKRVVKATIEFLSV